MNVNHKGDKQVMNQAEDTKTDMERLQERMLTCGPDCNCHTPKPGRKRLVLSAIIIVLAGALVARAILKDDGRPDSQRDGFALSQNNGMTAAAGPVSQESIDESRPSPASAPVNACGDAAENNPLLCGELIGAMEELDARASSKNGVFVFIAGEDAEKARGISEVIEKVAATLNGRGIKMGLYTLKSGSREYATISGRVPPPGVIAIAKGRGISAVSWDDITESKLMQAFVAALNAGGQCCPGGTSSSGCR